MPKEFTRDIFAQQMNTPFRIEHGVGSTIVELLEVSAMHSSPNIESFSIVFRGPSNAFLAQAMYHVHHDVLGAFDLFLVPIGSDNHSFAYEAVFNRMHREGQQ